MYRRTACELLAVDGAVVRKKNNLHQVAGSQRRYCMTVLHEDAGLDPDTMERNILFI